MGFPVEKKRIRCIKIRNFVLVICTACKDEELKPVGMLTQQNPVGITTACEEQRMDSACDG